MVAWLVIGLVEAQFFVSFGPAFDGIDLAQQELLQIARFVSEPGLHFLLESFEEAGYSKEVICTRMPKPSSTPATRVRSLSLDTSYTAA